MVSVCTEIIGRVYNHTGDFDELEWAVRSDLAGLLYDGQSQQEVKTLDEIMNYETETDGKNLIGNRYLCRGGAMIIVGPSGIGKSSLITQLVCTCAIGGSLFGIRSEKPLKCLIVQAENDDGDVKEMMSGVIKGLHFDAFSPEYDVANRNIAVVSDSTHSGQEFISFLRQTTAKHLPDVIVLDPAVSFIGDDLSKQSVCSQFFRLGINPILKEFNCGCIVINHTTKPPADSKGRKGWQSSDWQYAGAGSYDIVGWSRAVMILRECGGGNFNLKLTKRGQRAGATQPDGTPTRDLWLRHSNDSICWVQVDPPEEPEEGKEPNKGGKPSVTREVAGSNLHGFLAGCTAEGEGLNVISKRLEAWLASQRKDISYRTCQRIIPLLVANGKLTKTENGLYTKGVEA